MVNGLEYDQPMPSNEKLLDEEITHLINYIQNAWGNAGVYTSPEQVEKGLNYCN